MLKMLDKLKRAFAAYKKMGKVKKFFLTTIVSIVTIVTVFFGGIFISALVDVIKNPDSTTITSTTTTTEAITNAIIDKIATTLSNEAQSIDANEDVTVPNLENSTTLGSANTTIPNSTEKVTSAIVVTTRATTTKVNTTKAATTVNAKVDLSKIPAYSNKAYVKVNNNQPGFSSSDLTTNSFEKYSSLDSKGRCGVAYACVGKDLMPTGERGSIGSVKPTGWETVKYAGIDGNYLYNRCHLIGWQLTGENANEKNLITGTRYMNVDGMLPFENMVADYIEETGNHVLYRVTPIFQGNNLLASGVQIEAYSVEDNGDGICFNVYCYNVQPGVKINYADGSSTGPAFETTTKKVATTKSSTTTKKADSGSSNSEIDYVLNTNTGKFHKPSCSSVKDIKPENREDFKGSRDAVINRGFEPCGRCHP